MPCLLLLLVLLLLLLLLLLLRLPLPLLLLLLPRCHPRRRRYLGAVADTFAHVHCII